MKINYINQQKMAHQILMENQCSPTERSVYMALFMIWNQSGWREVLSVNRQDVMALSGVGSKVTYTNCLKKLDSIDMIKYNPSYNPLIGSTIEMYNLCTSTEQVVDKLCTSTEPSSRNSSDTLYKQLNYKTIKLIEDNATLVDSKLEEWIKSETKEDDTNEELDILSFSVISYLNDKTSSNFKVTDKLKKSIGARMKDGHELEDFKKVIDSKCEEWLGDSKMKKYLRPSTLFGTKFDEYRGQIKTEKLIGGITNEQSRKIPVPDYNDLFKD